MSKLIKHIKMNASYTVDKIKPIITMLKENTKDFDKLGKLANYIDNGGYKFDFGNNSGKGFTSITIVSNNILETLQIDVTDNDKNKVTVTLWNEGKGPSILYSDTFKNEKLYNYMLNNFVR